MRTRFLSLALMALGTCTAWAGSICPAGNGATPFPYNPDNAGTGCNVVITINADRSTTVTLKDSNPYENSEDVLVGVINNSSSSVPSISINGGSGNDIFGFDGDGMCTYTFVGSGYCSGAVYRSDPGDYYGPNTTFVVTNANAGTVNFITPLAPGGTAYFSTEGLPSASLTAAVGPSGSPTAAAGAPALSVWAILLLASMLLGYSLWAIRNQRQRQG